jgi:hypothetical protein
MLEMYAAIRIKDTVSGYVLSRNRCRRRDVPIIQGSSTESAGKFEAESSGVAIKEPLGNLNNKA